MTACAELLRDAWPEIRFSSVYRTAAREKEDQPDFLNAVARIETEQAPEEIIMILRAIESNLKKAPPYRFGPRTIDLDLLLYDDVILGSGNEPTSNELVIPHPRMHERRFVLEPLCELTDESGLHPVLHTSWKDLLKQLTDQRIESTDMRL